MLVTAASWPPSSYWYYGTYIPWLSRLTRPRTVSDSCLRGCPLPICLESLLPFLWLFFWKCAMITATIGSCMVPIIEPLFGLVRKTQFSFAPETLGVEIEPDEKPLPINADLGTDAYDVKSDMERWRSDFVVRKLGSRPVLPGALELGAVDAAAAPDPGNVVSYADA